MTEQVMKSSQDFIYEIEKTVSEFGINHLDALMYHIEKYELDAESVASIIRKNPNIKAKLYEDCMKLNLVEKIKTIPGL